MIGRAVSVFLTDTHVLVSIPVGGPYRPPQSNYPITPVRRVLATPRSDSWVPRSGMLPFSRWPRRVRELP